MRMKAPSVFVLLVGISLVSARTLRVPEEFSTISAAFDEVVSNDTVLITSGIYVEALESPALDFVVKGTIEIDSNGTDFAIIDPTDLPGSDSLRCVTMTGGKITFEDILFRNRFAMTEGRAASETAGVKGDSLVDDVVFRRCIFDSVNVGISDCRVIHLDHCRFIGSLGIAAVSLRPGAIYANDTWFDGASGGLVSTKRGGHLSDCLFTHRGLNYMLLALGDSLQIEDCRFVGLDTLNGRAVWLRPRCGSIMRDCSFENILAGFNAVLEIADTCFGQPVGSECAFQFINNRFVNCGSWQSTAQQGGEMLSLRCADPERGYLALLDSNRIDSTRRILGKASGLNVDGSCKVMNTWFNAVQDSDEPQIYFEEREFQDTLIFRGNSFSQHYYGMLRSQDGPSFVDARDNWWGSSTGPFHPNLNSDGQGAEVDDGIDFIPWLTTNPDSSDTSNVAVDDEVVLQPANYLLTAYPNPFNATTTLQIEVARGGEYEVVLFDVTGRRAATLFRGRIETSHALRIDAGELPSGVYFARLSGTTGPLTCEKLLLLK